jgi:magnesium transporter
MARFLKSRIKTKGTAPGSLIFIGNKKMDTPRFRLFRYNQESTFETEFKTIGEAIGEIKTDQVNWLNIDGLHDVSTIEKLGKHFEISPLALEDILDTGQRSRLFEDKNSLTILAKAGFFDNIKNKISVDQISFILCKHVVITFQERTGDHFEPVRERIRKNIGWIRNLSEDYLLYTLIDSLVDNYLITIEQIGDKVEQLENKLSVPDKETSAELFHLKTEVTFFRKSIRPLKEVMTRLLRSNSDLIHKESVVYYQELNDLVDYSNEAIDTYFNMIADQINLYNTNLNSRVNDVMKVLTVFATIFIPLTFIVGIYGTNFDYLPELHFRYSYFIMWGIMVLIALVMLYYFRKNRWF